MPQKKFYRSAKIKPIAVGFGACLATDRIMVDGARVGYCYREEPSNSVYSGWRFLAGDESQDYVDIADHWAFYDINTVANYDPSIAAVIEAPCGSAYERNEAGVLEPIREDEA